MGENLQKKVTADGGENAENSLSYGNIPYPQRPIFVTAVASIAAISFLSMLMLPSLWRDPSEIPSSLLEQSLAYIGFAFSLVTIGYIFIVGTENPRKTATVLPYFAVVISAFLSAEFATALANYPGADWTYGYLALLTVFAGSLYLTWFWWLAVVTLLQLGWIIPGILHTFNIVEATIPGVFVWRDAVIMGFFAVLGSAFIELTLKQHFRELTDIANQAVNVSTSDSLTGLINRHGAMVILDSVFSEPHQRTTPISLYMVDVDGLKKVNDTYGHLEGDSVIKIVSEALKFCTRESDYVTRWGGDEFLIVTTGNPASPSTLEDRINGWIQDNGDTIARNITVSVGCSTVPLDSENIAMDTILMEADMNMYARKESRRR